MSWHSRCRGDAWCRYKTRNMDTSCSGIVLTSRGCEISFFLSSSFDEFWWKFTCPTSLDDLGDEVLLRSVIIVDG